MYALKQTRGSEQRSRRFKRLERTSDTAEIKGIVTHPRVFPHVVDDYSPAPTEWQPIMRDGLAYFLVIDDLDRAVGLFAVEARSHTHFDYHVCFLPEGYGAIAESAAHALFDLIFSSTPCVRITGDVPAYNRAALQYASRVGMRAFAVNEKSHRRCGVLHDTICFGISKPGA